MLERITTPNEVKLVRRARGVMFALCVVIIPMAIFFMMMLFFGAYTAHGYSIWLAIGIGVFAVFALVFIVFAVCSVIIISKYLREVTGD